MDELELEALVHDISVKKPDIIFVAMGSPKQEFVMQNMYNKHKALYMGLGGSFDIYAGQKRRAPNLFRKLGLEWIYRLIMEPNRISRQSKLFSFTYKLLRDKL